MLGVSQPKISEITRGRVAAYSVERLLHIVNRLGRSVEVRISKRDAAEAMATTRVKVA